MASHRWELTGHCGNTKYAGAIYDTDIFAADAKLARVAIRINEFIMDFCGKTEEMSMILKTARALWGQICSRILLCARVSSGTSIWRVGCAKDNVLKMHHGIRILCEISI